jgi:hypothetical protein
MLEGLPIQKITLFVVLLLIAYGTSGLFLVAYPLAAVGKVVLLIVFCWYSAGQLMHSVINQNNLIGRLNKRAVLITGQ